MEAASQRPDSDVSKNRAEDVVCVRSFSLPSELTRDCYSYQMFEPNMDEYLDEEIESLKQTFDQICKSWDEQVPPP